MKHKLTLALLFVTLFSFGQGQLCKQDLFPKQSKNRKWGYVNLFNQWQILPTFTTANAFRGKTAVVLIGKKYGAVNCDGRLIVPCQYEVMKDFVGGKAWVKKDGLWGLVNDEGKRLLHPLYKEIKEIASYSDQIWVLHGQYWGVYDLQKETFVYEPQFTETQVLDAKTSLVKTDKYSGIIRVDKAQVVYPMQIEKVLKVAPYRLAIKENKKWGMITYHGVLLVKPQYDTLFFKYKNLLQVEKETKKGLVNYKGRVVTPVQFDEIADFHQGGAKVCKAGECGFISVRGRLVLPLEFTFADRFSNGLCIAKKENKYGLINAKNEWVVTDTFGFIKSGVGYAYYVAEYKGQEYFINQRGELKINKSFEFIDLDVESKLVRVKKEGYFLYDFDRDKQKTTEKYDHIEKRNGNVFLFKSAGKYGVLDTLGKEVIPNNYEVLRIENKRLQYFFIKQGGEWGLRLLSKELIRMENEELAFLDANYLLVKKNGLYGITRKTGRSAILPLYTSLRVAIENKKLVFPLVYKKKKKCGLVNKRGVELKLPKHSELKYIQNGLFAYAKKGKWGIIDKKGNILLTPQYDTVGKYNKGWIEVVLDGKSLFVNKKGRVE